MLATQIHGNPTIEIPTGGQRDERIITYRGITASLDRYASVGWSVTIKTKGCEIIDDALALVDLSGETAEEAAADWCARVDRVLSRLAAILARAGEPVSANGGVQVVSVAPPPSVTAWVGSTLAIGQGGGQ